MINSYENDPRLIGKEIKIIFCYDGPTFVMLDGVKIGVIGCSQKPNSNNMGFNASGAGSVIEVFDKMDDAVSYIVDRYFETGKILEY
jgi:hypothetical protein